MAKWNEFHTQVESRIYNTLIRIFERLTLTTALLQIGLNAGYRKYPPRMRGNVEFEMALVALLISIAALLFGGFFTSRWQRSINKPKVSVAVMSVRRGDLNDADGGQISLPEQIVKRSAAAKFFPTLQPQESRKKIARFLENFGDANNHLARIRIALKEVMNEDVTDERAGKIWDSLSVATKAFLFTVRTSRTRQQALSEIDIPNVLSEMLASEQSTMDAVEKQLQKRMLGGAIAQIQQIETAPTKSLVTEVLQGELELLELLASEVDYFSRNIDLRASSVSGYWEVRVKIYNAGGMPAVLLPLACMAIQRPAMGNLVLPLNPIQSVDNVVVAPGEALDLVFRSSSDAKQEIHNALYAQYSTGDRDFRMVLESVDGKRTISAPTNFSSKMSSVVLERLSKYAESLEVSLRRP